MGTEVSDGTDDTVDAEDTEGTAKPGRKKKVAWIAAISAVAALVTAIAALTKPIIELFEDGGGGSPKKTATAPFAGKGLQLASTSTDAVAPSDPVMLHVGIQGPDVWAFTGKVANLDPKESVVVVLGSSGDGTQTYSGRAQIAGDQWSATVKAPTTTGSAITWLAIRRAASLDEGTLPFTDPQSRSYTVVVK